MKALRKIMQHPLLAGLSIGTLVLAALLAARAAGWLQLAELRVYDQFMRWGSNPGARDDRIVICGMTEDDLIKYGHPLQDVQLAELLETLAAQKPSVIGIDIHRDLPEPRSGEGAERLAETLRRNENVIAIDRVPTIPPPPALADRPDRVAPNNVPEDWTVDGVRRRAYLFLEGGLPVSRPSLALTLALAHLETCKTAFHLDVTAPGGPLLQLGATWLPRLTPDAGGYVGLPIRDYEVLIDFRGAQQFATCSFSDVLEGRLPPDALAGRIVLVAVATDSVKDNKGTPLDTNLRGVTQQAIALHQLLRAALDGVPLLRWWPEPAEVAWIAAATLFGGWAGVHWRTPWTLAPAVAALLAAIGLAAWLAFAGGVWIPAVAPALGGCVAATFGASLGARLERTDRRTLEALFSKHVSPSVADALWKERERILDGGRLKPQRLTATILFTDLKDFTMTAEGKDPAEVLDWMNEYMNGIVRHVELQGGVVNSFMGDAIMAVFGAPVARSSEAAIDDDAAQAVKCALAMRHELSQLNAGWRDRDLPVASMRVGIHTGPVVAGSIGSDQRIEFTVFGESVIIAARIESAGKGVGDEPEDAECRILISDSTCQRVRGRFVTACLGPMELKGKKNTVIVHRVISAAIPETPP